MAVRVASLGGLFSRLSGGQARIQDTHLQMLTLSPPALFSLPLWFVCVWLDIPGLNPVLRSVRVTSFSCRPLSAPAPHFQADGESLGRIPFEVTLVNNALRMLIPDLEKKF